MKLLQCNICEGELDIIAEEGIHKLVKCRDCGFTSDKEKSKKQLPQPEIMIRRNRT